MKKLTLLLGALMIAGLTFAGDGDKKACCKKGDKKEACAKKDDASCKKGSGKKACCKDGHGKKEAKAESNSNEAKS
jgi:hypothetical protein